MNVTDEMVEAAIASIRSEGTVWLHTGKVRRALEAALSVAPTNAAEDASDCVFSVSANDPEPVKQLTWSEKTEEWATYWSATADPLMGDYSIWQLTDACFKKIRRHYILSVCHAPLGSFTTLDLAKAAAQADFEARQRNVSNTIEEEQV